LVTDMTEKDESSLKKAESSVYENDVNRMLKEEDSKSTDDFFSQKFNLK